MDVSFARSAHATLTGQQSIDRVARVPPPSESMPMRVTRAAATVLLMLALGACSTLRESEPGRTATEQLIFSTAIERVCDELALEVPVGSQVFVDASYVEGTDSK